jgi:hypothetical protein
VDSDDDDNDDEDEDDNAVESRGSETNGTAREESPDSLIPWSPSPTPGGQTHIQKRKALEEELRKLNELETEIAKKRKLVRPYPACLTRS